WTPSGSTTLQPQKTGFYYVDDNSLNTTGPTQGAEVMRLAMKAFRSEWPRLATGLNAGNGSYDYASSLDPAKQNYYYFSVNRNAVTAGNQYDVTVNMSGWNVAAGQVIGVEEVSDASHGQVT